MFEKFGIWKLLESFLKFWDVFCYGVIFENFSIFRLKKITGGICVWVID